MKKPVVLRIYKGDQLMGVKQFADPQIVIGRQGEVQVALEGDSVSIIHASIEERGETYSVMDLGSESGTFLNGERVLDVELESGDVLKIGEYKIEFYIGVPRPKGYSDATIAARSTMPKPAAPQAAPQPPQAAPQPPPVVSQPVAPPQPPPVVSQQVVTPQPPPAAPQPPPSVVQPPPVAAPVPEAPKQEAPKQHPIIPVFPKSVPVPPPSAPSAPEKTEKEEPKVVPVPPPPTIQPQTAANRIETGSPAGVGMAGVTGGVTGGIAAGLGAPSTMRVPPPMPGGATRRATPPHKPHKTRFSKTFAPPSKYKDVRDYVKPSKGTVVEILVAWRERVIATYHFSSAKTITMGSHPSNDVVLPLFATQVRKLPIVKIDRQAIVLIAPEMKGELIRGQAASNFAELIRQNRMVNAGNGYTLALEQGEMVQVDIGEQVSVIVRYVSDSPKPLVAPLFDLTASEFTGVVLSLAMVGMLWLYTYLYSPPKVLGDEENNEPQRTAIIMLKPPTPPPLPPPADPTPAPTPVAPPPTPPPKVVKVKPTETKTAPQAATKKAQTATNLTTKQDPGKSAAAAPNKNKTGPRTQTSVKQGGAIKTADKEGSQMQSKSRDLSKAGVFSAFGSGGAQDKLAGSTTGSGELAGMAAASSGKAGSATNRAGQGLGSELKDTGMGGNGKSLEGIAGGVGTTGRGSGNSGYGTGGLGNRAGVKIVTGGTEEQIGVGIDKEAIRRVIMANLRVIRSCYEKQLNRHPDLFGKLVLSWDIGEQGRVVATRVKSNELGNREVADCITDKLKGWRFPEPPANQVVVVEAYPFFFSN